MADVQLVYMPYLPIDYPSVGMSVLLGGLKRAGVSARQVYANAEFAKRIGLELYQLSEFQLSNHFVEDWSFRDAIYEPSTNPPSWERERSLDYQPRYVELLTEYRGKDLYALAREMREHALAWVVELAQRVLDDGAKIVGASTMHLQNIPAIALMKTIKRLSPETITILGGPGCEAEMGVAVHRRYPFVDYAVSGEPDAFFPDFCKRLLAAEGPLPADQVPLGVLHPHHRATGVYPSPPPRVVLQDPDQAAPPDYDDFFQTLERTGFIDQLYLRIPLETARGCWWGQRSRCRFCSYQADAVRYRSKSPERVLEEMQALWEKYGRRDLFVVDSIMEPRYLDTVIPRLAERGRPYKIFWEMKANLREPQIELLSRAGVNLIEAGIESFVDPVLRSFKKGNSAIKSVEFLRNCIGHGVTNGWNFLIGAPGEKDEWYGEVNQWLPLVTHLQPPMYVISVQFPRFSTYFEQAKEYGLSLEPLPGYRDVHPFEDLGALAFAHHDPKVTAAIKQSVHRLQLTELIKAWRQLFFSGFPPRLVYKDDGQKVEVRDTRPVAVEFKTELTGVDRAVFLHCLEATRVHVVPLELAQGQPAHGREKVLESLERLVHLKLVLRLGDQVLTLATRPIISFPVFDRQGISRNDRYHVFRRLLPHKFPEYALHQVQDVVQTMLNS